MALEWLSDANRLSPWAEANVLVTGIGRSGFAAANALLDLGAKVTVVDGVDSEANQDKAKLLEFLDGTALIGPEAATALPEPAPDLVITSPGWAPHQPLLAEAAARKIPIWGEVELAWRLQQPDKVIPWLGITGTNGKTTTTQMVESILRAEGLSTAAVGNIGRPVLEALMDEVDYDVLVVELSSFQLHWSHSLSLHSAAVLNIHPDHMEWYDGDEDGYRLDKGKIYQRVTHACVYNVAEPATEKLVEDAEVVEGARAIGFTIGIPSMSMMGLVDEILVDRAFVAQRRTSALELCTLDDVHPPTPHNVENALAAAALTRSFGVSAAAVKRGLSETTLGGHRIELVATHDGVTWIDDSKATNPHAANASLRGYDPVIWIAGGEAKGTSFDELVKEHATRLKGVVLLGVDAPVIMAALAQHAPDVPVRHITSRDNEAMEQVVRAAADMASEGDTVLLAPGCASKDMYSGYDARGAAFADAVKNLMK